jgi:DNA ligase (NAD+)
MTEILGEHPFKGQLLEIYRANMIIPQVFKSIKLEETSYSVSIEDLINLPTHCAICGCPLEIKVSDSGIKTLICPDPLCEGRIVNRLDHFCGKKGLDIKGLSVATLDKLVDWGWVDSIEDIFKLNQYATEWKKKEGFGEKSVNNILNSIEKAKTCELHSFIAALGIPFIGTQVAKDLCEYVYDYADFRDRVYDGWNFASIPSFGQVKMKAILDFDYTEADNIARLLTLSNTKEEKQDTLEGKIFVVTGKLHSFKNRTLLKETIEKCGGKVTDSVTSKTNFLINNDKNSGSSKNLKAKELNVPIISEEEFLKMIDKSI